MAEAKDKMQNKVVSDEQLTVNADTEIIQDTFEEMGVISEGTVVKGNVRTKGHIAILGELTGDVEAKGNVIISGKIKGKIVCNNLVVDGGVVESSIRVLGQVNIKSGSVVNGNVSCRDFGLSGTLNGNVKASNQACFYAGAQLKGDLKAKELGVEIGAKISGAIQMK